MARKVDLDVPVGPVAVWLYSKKAYEPREGKKQLKVSNYIVRAGAVQHRDQIEPGHTSLWRREMRHIANTDATCGYLAVTSDASDEAPKMSSPGARRASACSRRAAEARAAQAAHGRRHAARMSSG